MMYLHNMQMVCLHKHFVWALGTCRWKNDILLNIMYKLLLLVTCASIIQHRQHHSQCVCVRECFHSSANNFSSHCFLNNDMMKATEMKRSHCILLHRYRVCAMCTTSERPGWGLGGGEHQCSFFVATSSNM